MSDSAGIEREKHMKQLKRLMEWCREAILLLNSILLWERSWYPGLIVGTTSTIFFLIWVLEPALLTIISVSLLVLALVDYLVSPLTALLCSSWTGQKERKLNEICQNLSVTLLQLQNLWRSMLQYYVGLIVCLTICIWVGNAINNLLLFYIAVNAILLMPGLRRKGRAMLSISFVRDYVSHAEKT
ncbi:ADP-ribosylation factor-like protein 6-interacting protein 1 isoform X2 [Colletes gigas]|uniref:ADP-ribosylation factor-like protein 6-interacting protein 1 isoform X2 n=1 Tax=Colletes gigas TaxID=935657 RepID=UPI001C9B6536|nr:ADP-ribosylation factor-like protein 6-interacting protein 1 isoform X2 [Colletes gigas]